MTIDSRYLLKKIAPPSMKEFDRLLKKARKTVKEVGLEPSDVDALIQEARSEK